MLMALLCKKQKVISFWSNSRENKFASATKCRVGRNVWNLRVAVDRKAKFSGMSACSG
jgi:hypothetical protein